MKIRVSFLLPLLGLLAACSSAPQTESPSGLSPEETIISLTRSWNDNHAPGKKMDLAPFYASDVLFYQQKETGKSSVEKKLAYFAKYPDYRQEIAGEIKVTTADSVTYRASFTKRVKAGGKIEDYRAYMDWRQSGNTYLIVTEGDETTDRNIARRSIPKEAAMVEGDFNGDGQKEQVWLKLPDALKEGRLEEGADCDCQLVFSNKAILPINVKSCIGGAPVNEGDLNGDGSDEIGLLPEWWTSCWNRYFVFTSRKGKWDNLVPAFSVYACNEDNVDFISKDPNHPKTVIIRYSEISAEDITVSEKPVTVE